MIPAWKQNIINRSLAIAWGKSQRKAKHNAILPIAKSAQRCNGLGFISPFSMDVIWALGRQSNTVVGFNLK